MNAVQIEAQTERSTETAKDCFQFPHGLLGFERVKAYRLLQKEQESPFLWLQMMEEPEFTFLLVPSLMCFPDYNPELSREDLSLLQIGDPENLMMFNIVTLHPGGKATANLKGPVLLNRENNIGAQFVANNAGDYAVNQSLSA